MVTSTMSPAFVKQCCRRHPIAVTGMHCLVASMVALFCESEDFTAAPSSGTPIPGYDLKWRRRQNCHAQIKTATITVASGSGTNRPNWMWSISN